MAELRIGRHIVIQKPLTVKGLELDMDSDGKKELYVNKLGQPLKKLQLQKAEYSWKNTVTDTEETGKSYKSFKGKPIASFTKSKEITQFEWVDSTEKSNFIENEKTYQLISDSLKTELIEHTGKALVFRYVNSGFKIHKAFVEYDEELKAVLMRCYRGDLRKIDLSENTVVEATTKDEGVEQLDLNALE